MTKEDKKRNKEHCKNMPLDVKMQCWYSRNGIVIKTILLSAATSLVTHLIIIGLLILSALALGADA